MTEGPPPAPLRWQKAVITRILPRTPGVASFFLRLSEPFRFLAGQHVDVRLSAPDGYTARRSYSIASAPAADGGSAGEIELTIERLEDGEVSPYFHDVAAVGDEIELRGPIGGHFVWTVADGGPVLLIGGGSGVVPLMSMIRHRAAQGSAAPMALLLSARRWEDVIYRDELIGLQQTGGGFELMLTHTREPARRPGDHARRVDAAMLADLLARLAQPPKQVYVCGPNPFVEASTLGLLGCAVPAAIIRTERYGG
jgi:ferredoxin-NADP reductase